MTGCFNEENGGLGRNGLIQEQMGAEVSPRATPTRGAPATMASEESLKAIICELERQLSEKEVEIKEVKVKMSEEIQGLKIELHAMGILLKGKGEQIRRSNRRSKLRVYLP